MIGPLGGLLIENWVLGTFGEGTSGMWAQQAVSHKFWTAVGGDPPNVAKIPFYGVTPTGTS